MTNGPGKSDRPAAPKKSLNNTGQPVAEGTEGRGLAKENLPQQNALEDKIVQRAAVEVLNAIYETDFLGFSSGFRPGRSQHQALDALYTGLLTRKVNWVLDLDIQGFSDGLSHAWLVKFVEHRIADRRVVRLIQKWLNAGVLEEGKRIRTEEGTPQGGSASLLLANVYPHYVFDLWVQAWRRKRVHGDVIIVRFADDIVLGFEEKSDAEQFRGELTERMRKFNLELHPEKTRLLEFGPIDSRKWRGEGKPETFNFLGFTHLCVKKRSNGRFTVLRQTIRKRLQAKLNEVKAELQRRMHEPIPKVGKWLQAVVHGHIRYYGAPLNQHALWIFRFPVGWLWHRALSRRSQNGRVLWDRMRRLITRWRPVPTVCPPYLLRCLGVVIQGKSRMRERRLSGSMEGVVSDHDSYSDFSSLPSHFQNFCRFTRCHSSFGTRASSA
jgi:RNA-directed DNA polymerase